MDEERNKMENKEEAKKQLNDLLKEYPKSTLVTLPNAIKLFQSVNPDDIRKIWFFNYFSKNIKVIFFIFLSIFALFSFYDKKYILNLFTNRNEDLQCIIDLPDIAQRAFRPPEDCSICRDLKLVERVANVSPKIFEERYAYTGRPLVVTDAMQNWTAPKLFSFDYFKNIYEDSPQPGCQFFPYVTEFRSLREVFNMTKERMATPWYVGWSNCDEIVAAQLREKYSQPYFLPETSESKQLDWIFMGSTGYGAHMHVDNVGHPSWQAQLKGSKLWILQPPPECIYQCNTIQVTVHSGEIIVLDTNRWYHQTLIVSDEMSITIGAEFD